MMAAIRTAHRSGDHERGAVPMPLYSAEDAAIGFRGDLKIRTLLGAPARGDS
jgi:hypothetical protein